MWRILLTLTGVPFAALISIAAFFITLIPLIGTIVTTIVMTLAALLYSLPAAIIVLIRPGVRIFASVLALSLGVLALSAFVPAVREFVLKQAGGNQTLCAEMLGINRNTLRRKLSEHELL